MRVRDGAAIKRRRLERGLSQRELAYLARPCSQTTIYLVETERLHNLNDDLATRIARRLDIAVDALFHVEEKEEEITVDAH
ncbi:MAG: helix-turn-helix transcriptional regulator [Actinomycetota bacterium]